IRHRVADELRRDLGWSDWEIEQLQNDWVGPGASSYVIYLEEDVLKTPSNLILGNTGTGPTRIARTLTALRLHADGDVSTGALFHARRAKFNVGLGGLGQTPSTTPRFTFGGRYRLAPEDAPAV